jgi:hypothetical protein
MTYVVIGSDNETGQIRVVGSFYHTARADQAVKVLSIAEPDWKFSYADLEDGVTAVQQARHSIRTAKRLEKQSS